LRIDGPAVVRWARRAEERGFSALTRRAASGGLLAAFLAG
jgi:hypothetical protein